MATKKKPKLALSGGNRQLKVGDRVLTPVSERPGTIVEISEKRVSKSEFLVGCFGMYPGQHAAGKTYHVELFLPDLFETKFHSMIGRFTADQLLTAA